MDITVVFTTFGVLALSRDDDREPDMVITVLGRYNQQELIDSDLLNDVFAEGADKALFECFSFTYEGAISFEDLKDIVADLDALLVLLDEDAIVLLDNYTFTATASN